MMKRKEKKVPGLDEIIFENRNKDYGAYDLRKRYKSVTSFSILGALIVCTAIVLIISTTSEPAIGSEGKKTIVIIQPEDFKPEVINKPEVKPPSNIVRPQNVAPVVVDTTVETTFIPITDIITKTIVNGDINDTVVYIEQVIDVVPVEPEVFIKVEEMPEFPGGESALLAYIGKNTIYPVESIENNIEGRVFLKFVVKPDGAVGNIEIMKGVDPLLDKEAVRVVGTLPKFKPGRQSGVPVSVWYSVPVLFRISR